MSKYITNPKTDGSGIICSIPQKGTCQIGCRSCYFTSGRSYLEPLEENTPNIPMFEDTIGRVVRINDGNDSNYQRDIVMQSALYTDQFFNTSIPRDLSKFVDPVVLTVNPGKMTDKSFHKLEVIPDNLMFVRIRANAWNIEKVVDPAIEYYTVANIPVVLTFMAYYEDRLYINNKGYASDYEWKQRTLNSYWCLTQEAQDRIMGRYKLNPLVYQCTYKNTYACSRCGNCIREYYNTKERLRS